MLITKNKLDELLDLMTTKKAKRAAAVWAVNQGSVTLETIDALEDVSNEELVWLLRFANQEASKRGLK